MGAVLLFSALIVGISTAATGTVTPDSIAPGGMFTVIVADVPDNTTISIQVQGEFSAQPGGAFSYQLTNMTWPVDIGKNNSTVRLENTQTNKVTWSKLDTGSGEEWMTIVEGPSVQGIFTRTVSDLDQVPDVNETMYNVLFEGTAANSSSTVVATMFVLVNKTGPDDFSIPVHVGGISAGLVRVSVFVGDQMVVAKTLTVGTPDFHDATLRVTSVPLNAAVFIDSVYAGQTPLYAKVATGVRTVRFVKAGYYPQQKTITVGYSPGQVIPVYAELVLMPLGAAPPASSGSGSSGVPVLVQPYIPIRVDGGTYTPGIIITPNPPSVPGGVISINPNAIVQRTAPFPFL